MNSKAIQEQKNFSLRLPPILLAVVFLVACLPLFSLPPAVWSAEGGAKGGESSQPGSQPGVQAPRLGFELQANPSVKKVLPTGETFELDVNNLFYDDDSLRATLTYYVKEGSGGWQQIADRYSYTYTYTGTADEASVVLAFKASDGLHDSQVYQVTLKYYKDFSLVPPLEWLRYKVGPTGVTIVECEQNTPAVDIPDYIEGKPVTNIAAEAFYGCDKLTAIRLPNTLKTIGNQAFWFCTALEKIDLPEGLTQVGEEAFRDCHSLAEINIPASLQDFNLNVFEKCQEIRFRVAAENPRFTGWEGVLYDKDMTTLLRAGAIAGGSLTVPDPVTEISARAFLNNELQSITLGPNVKTIGDYAFQGCARLKEVVLNQGLKSIGTGAFEGAAALRTVSLPDSLAALGKIVFRESGLEKIDLAPTRLTVLPYGTFNRCAQLWDITLSDKITVIEDSVFAGCRSLQEITLPAKLHHLGSGCFANCNLETIRLPYTLKQLGSNVFANCESLKTLYFEGNMPLRGGQIGVTSAYSRENDSFAQLPLPVAGNLKIYVLQGAQGWGDSFKDYADGYPLGPTIRVNFEYKVNYYTLDELKEEHVPRLIVHAPESFVGLEIGSVSEPVGVIKAGMPSDVGVLEWSSSHTSVATVGSSGRVTALSEGESIISASLVNNGTVYTGEAEVYVIGPTVFDWNVQSDGTVIINGFKEGADDYEKMAYLEIPERIAGYPVTAIKNSAFQKSQYIMTLKIPGSVKEIGQRAFYYCVLLREITLEEGVERIGNAAFQGTAIREIVVPRSGVTAAAGINTGASSMIDVFKDCRELETAIVKAENLDALLGTFQDCVSLKNVTLAEGVKNIAGTFQGCTSLESITLPSTVQRIDSAFWGCTSLKTVELQSYLLGANVDFNPFAGYSRTFRMPYQTYWTHINYAPCSEDLVVVHPDDGSDWGSLFNNKVKTGVRTASGVLLDGFSVQMVGTGPVTTLNIETGAGTPAETALGSSPESLEEPAGEEGDSNPAQNDTTVFEIVKNSVAANPLLTIFIGLVVLSIIFFGGAGRYRRYKQNQ